MTSSLHYFIMPKKPGKDAGKSEEKKNTSLRLDKKTLKALKLCALEDDTSVQKIIEDLIADYLRKRRK